MLAERLTSETGTWEPEGRFPDLVPDLEAGGFLAPVFSALRLAGS